MKAVLLLTVFVAVFVGAVAFASDTVVTDSACFEQTGKAGIDACAALSDAIGRDRMRFYIDAQTLENLGKYESALVLYRAGAGHFPKDRRILQGLIRTRAMSRARRVLHDLEPEAEEVSPCWTERWMPAFEACRTEVAATPGDARLQERFGDVARSVGNVAVAQSAYARSLALVSDNLNLHRKREALAQLLSGTSSSHVAVSPPPDTAEDERSLTVAAATAPLPTESVPRPSSDGETVRQLELLKELRDRQLIDAAEYTSRRSALMASAFGGSRASNSAPRYRGLAGGRYLAVVIGNNDYAGFPKLETASADARAISNVLATRYGFEVTTLINADRYRIMTTLSELRQNASAADSILLYYAGHGLLDEQADRGYWLPVDAEPGNIAQWISTTDITGVLAGADAKHALVIADSCFAGTLLRAGTTTGFETLQRLAKKRSRTVLTSGGLEPVVDDGDSMHSVFARALLDALAKNEDVIEASRLFTAVRDRVVINADQTPQYAPMQRAGHDGGDFLFIPKTIYTHDGT